MHFVIASPRVRLRPPEDELREAISFQVRRRIEIASSLSLLAMTMLD